MQDSNKPDNLSITPNKNNLNKTDPKLLLFFSEYCVHSKELLTSLKQKNLLDDVHLICIDNRFVKENVMHVYMNISQTMALPPMITCVPTLCILPNYEIIKGSKISDYFAPMAKNINEAREEINLEPNSFSLESETNGSFGVSSDNFSFWDTSNDELAAQGNAGGRQMYTYASINDSGHEEQIRTPSEEKSSDKIPINLEQIQQQRNSEI